MDKKMFMKKKDKEEGMSDNERDAKMTAVGAMRDMAAKMMGDKLDGIKKVTVAADDKDGLKEGLDKAKELVSAGPTNDEEGTDASHLDGMANDKIHGGDIDEDEAEEDEELSKPGAEHEGMDEMSEDEINAKLEHLMALKGKLAASRKV